MSTSYAPRLYAKEYAGGDRVFEVSYTGQQTRTPFIVYTNAFHGFYNGFQGVYTKSRTSTLAWQSNFAGTYVKSYEGFLNYNSIDTATYTKTYDKANVNFRIHCLPDEFIFSYLINLYGTLLGSVTLFDVNDLVVDS